VRTTPLPSPIRSLINNSARLALDAEKRNALGESLQRAFYGNEGAAALLQGNLVSSLLRN